MRALPLFIAALFTVAGGAAAQTEVPVEVRVGPAPGELRFDSSPPAVAPDAPGGAYGFSRYVFSDINGEIVTTLVEGPRGHQVRCQREDLPCSYLELKHLHESGAPIPAELQMTHEELGRLVGQLDTLAATLARYDGIDDACAEGYRATSEQNPNMGIHLSNPAYLDGEFDPARPEMLLFAREGGEQLSKDDLGQCVAGAWTGDADYRVVGAAFMLTTEGAGEDHPEGFAGSIDNWHVHYHSCDGLRSDAILPPDQCRARGGIPIEKSPWMIHAYAQPEFDNPSGVFSMWNPSIWPIVDAHALERTRRQAPEHPEPGSAHTSIVNFAFEEIRVSPGGTVTITNSDSVPHTVTSGAGGRPTGDFDSGALGTGQSFRARFDAPGEYPFHCTLHPWMAGLVVVQ